jgi:GAF domain-containing protein
VVLTAIRDTTGALTGYAKVTRDFTDRKRAEEAVMLQLSNALLSSMDVRKLLTAISASIREVLPHDAATLALYDEATHSLVVQFLSDKHGEVQRGDTRLPVEGSPAGEAFLKREPLILDKLNGTRFGQEAIRHFTTMGMASGCWVPLIHRGAAIGTIAVASRMENAFS